MDKEIDEQALKAQELLDRQLTKEFIKMNPPGYDGLKTGLAVEEWLLRMEKILDAMAIPDDGQRSSFLLRRGG